MKHLFKILGMACLIAITNVAFFSCSDDEDNLPKSYKMQINLNFNDDLSFEDLSDVKVSLTNEKGQEQIVDMIKASTEVTVLQGQYSLALTGKVTDVQTEYVAGKANLDLFADASVSINVEKIYKSALIFKAIYTTGAGGGPGKTPTQDSYFEIVNNSDEVQYLDQLLLSSPMTGKTKNAWQANGYNDIYESGQGVVIAFPGTGKDYPLEPGKSIVIANNAVDLNSLVEDKDPNKGKFVDLSKADWEIYVTPGNGEVDYKAPNMDVIFRNNKYMTAFGLGYFGRCYLLARLPQGMTPSQFAADKKNVMTTPGTSGSIEFMMIPSKYVIDAVEIWNASETEHNNTFLPKDDAQGVLSSDAWQGKCVRRKVVKIENGRPYYQDTNNSHNDFLRNQPLNPGVTPTEVDK